MTDRFDNSHITQCTPRCVVTPSVTIRYYSIIGYIPYRLYFSSLGLTYFITRSLYLLIPFTNFTHSTPPPIFVSTPSPGQIIPTYNTQHCAGDIVVPK